MPTLSPQVTPYYGGGQVNTPVDSIQTSGAPSSANINHNLGTIAVDNSTGTIYGLASKSGGSATWAILGGGTGAVSTLTAGSGGAISPSGGNINLSGTANEITTSGSGSTITFSIPSAFTAPGSITATTSLTATLGAITATNGNLVLGTAGNKQVYTSVASTTTAGANSAGSVALVAGTATVNTTAVTANSLIRLTCQALGTVVAPSALCVSAKSAGVSFTILASQNTDTSTIFWEIVN